jgi:hypothetical protein
LRYIWMCGALRGFDAARRDRGNILRYASAALLCAISLPFIAFAVSAGSLDALLLGLSGVAASVGMVVHQHQALRYVCAAILLANAVMILLGVASSGFSFFALALAALSLGAGVGILARQQWVRIPTVITSVMTLGPWIAAALTAAIAHRWPASDLGVGAISLMPGILLAAIWVWCPLTVARISTPRATAV